MFTTLSYSQQQVVRIEPRQAGADDECNLIAVICRPALHQQHVARPVGIDGDPLPPSMLLVPQKYT